MKNDKWNSLSLKNKSDLMRMYIKNGINDLNDIKKHYNSFQDGGEVSNDRSIIENTLTRKNNFKTALKDFYGEDYKKQRGVDLILDRNTPTINVQKYKDELKDWYTKRSVSRPDLVSEEQLKDVDYLLSNMKVINATQAIKRKEPFIVPSSFKEDYDTSYGYVPYIQAKHLEKNPYTGAVYSPQSHTVVVNDLSNRTPIQTYPASTILTHEMTHGLPLFTEQVREVMRKHGIKEDDYNNNPEEIYSRLNQLRSYYNIDPSKTYTMEEIEELRKDKTSSSSEGLDIFNKDYSNDFILDLFNSVALNNYNNSTVNFASKGGRINIYEEGGKTGIKTPSGTQKPYYEIPESTRRVLRGLAIRNRDKEALLRLGYDEKGNSIAESKGGNFGGSGAGSVWNTEDNIIESYDYVRNTPILRSFSDAFSEARKQGLSTFMFNNQEYTTDISDNPNYIGKRYEPKLNIREVLDENKKVISDSTRVEPYLGQIPGTHKRNKFQDGGKKSTLGVPYMSLNSSDYDYFNASPSNMPRNKKEHWTSRNEDGRILKGNNHPTLDLALNIEGLLGNKIYKNVDGTYSSYEEGQFPTSLGVHINNTNNDVSPLDPNKRFKNIKTTKGRRYNEDNILYISDKLNNTLLNDAQKNAILGSIIEESGGNPFAVDETGRFKGLLQWEDSRYSPDNKLSEKEELDNQLLYLMETLYNTSDKKSWTHGGTGSGYKSAKHAKDTFFNTDDLYKATHSLNRGYIRPTGGDYSVNNRYKVAKQLK